MPSKKPNNRGAERKAKEDRRAQTATQARNKHSTPKEPLPDTIDQITETQVASTAARGAKPPLLPPAAQGPYANHTQQPGIRAADAVHQGSSNSSSSTNGSALGLKPGYEPGHELPLGESIGLGIGVPAAFMVAVAVGMKYGGCA
jgi:hypothetical protein